MMNIEMEGKAREPVKQLYAGRPAFGPIGEAKAEGEDGEKGGGEEKS